ncbi:hypothetical protein BKA69DRAFT_1053294, partial [Paraphysoderma sedebokerense]
MYGQQFNETSETDYHLSKIRVPNGDKIDSERIISSSKTRSANPDALTNPLATPTETVKSVPHMDAPTNVLKSPKFSSSFKSLSEIASPTYKNRFIVSATCNIAQKNVPSKLFQPTSHFGKFMGRNVNNTVFEDNDSRSSSARTSYGSLSNLGLCSLPSLVTKSMASSSLHDITTSKRASSSELISASSPEPPDSAIGMGQQRQPKVKFAAASNQSTLHRFASVRIWTQSMLDHIISSSIIFLLTVFYFFANLCRRLGEFLRNQFTTTISFVFNTQKFKRYLKSLISPVINVRIPHYVDILVTLLPGFNLGSRVYKSVRQKPTAVQLTVLALALVLFPSYMVIMVSVVYPPRIIWWGVKQARKGMTEVKRANKSTIGAKSVRYKLGTPKVLKKN